MSNFSDSDGRMDMKSQKTVSSLLLSERKKTLNKNLNFRKMLFDLTNKANKEISYHQPFEFSLLDKVSIYLHHLFGLNTLYKWTNCVVCQDKKK